MREVGHEEHVQFDEELFGVLLTVDFLVQRVSYVLDVETKMGI